jgi:hypothetical protein
MVEAPLIDVRYDVRTDARGKDPDSHSATLRRYHQLLWSKHLPGGSLFDLDSKLHHASALGDFWLTSDAITHTYSQWTRPPRLVEVLSQIPTEEMAAFYDLGCTVGAYTVFPSKVYIDGRWRLSINGCRGMHPRLRDRFDLTLECIRRHYAGEDSPLKECLSNHREFFDLFDDFAGYVGYFLLDDLVTEDAAAVRFHTSFDDFAGDPLPAKSVAEYRTYMQRSMEFVQRRNERISRHAKALAAPDARSSHETLSKGSGYGATEPAQE